MMVVVLIVKINASGLINNDNILLVAVVLGVQILMVAVVVVVVLVIVFILVLTVFMAAHTQ